MENSAVVAHSGKATFKSHLKIISLYNTRRNYEGIPKEIAKCYHRGNG
jgi:hypothetical protein